MNHRRWEWFHQREIKTVCHMTNKRLSFCLHGWNKPQTQKRIAYAAMLFRVCYLMKWLSHPMVGKPLHSNGFD